MKVTLVSCDAAFTGYVALLPDYNTWLTILKKLGIVCFIKEVCVNSRFEQVTLCCLLGEITEQLQNKETKPINTACSLFFQYQGTIVFLTHSDTMQHDILTIKLAILDNVSESLRAEQE